MGLRILKEGDTPTPAAGREDGAGSDLVRAENYYARVVIQLSRLPFFSLDAKRPRQIELGLDYEIGAQTVEWLATADWDGAGRDTRRGGNLPGPYAGAILVALGRVWNATRGIETRDMKHIDSRTFSMSVIELLALMGTVPSGRVYGQLRETIARLKRVVITTSGGWKEEGAWVTDTLMFNLFDECQLIERPKSPEGGRLRFVMSYRLAKALADHGRLLDSGVYQRLRSATAKRLFELLDAERYQGGRGLAELRVPIAFLKDRLAIAAPKTAGVQRVLGTAHDDLVRVGWVEPVDYVEATADDYRRFPSRAGPRTKQIAARYRVRGDAVGGGGTASDSGGTEGGVMPVESPGDLSVAEAGVRLQAIYATAGIGVPAPDPDTSLAERVRRVCAVTGDWKNVRTFKRPCELLSERDYRDILNAIEKSKLATDSAAMLAATFIKRANHVTGTGSR